MSYVIGILGFLLFYISFLLNLSVCGSTKMAKRFVCLKMNEYPTSGIHHICASVEWNECTHFEDECNVQNIWNLIYIGIIPDSHSINFTVYPCHEYRAYDIIACIQWNELQLFPMGSFLHMLCGRALYSGTPFVFCVSLCLSFCLFVAVWNEHFCFEIWPFWNDPIICSTLQYIIYRLYCRSSTWWCSTRLFISIRQCLKCHVLYLIFRCNVCWEPIIKVNAFGLQWLKIIRWDWIWISIYRLCFAKTKWDLCPDLMCTFVPVSAPELVCQSIIESLIGFFCLHFVFCFVLLPAFLFLTDCVP